MKVHNYNNENMEERSIEEKENGSLEHLEKARVSQDQALSLMNKMISLGYFHQNKYQDIDDVPTLIKDTIKKEQDDDGMTIETMKQEQTDFATRMKYQSSDQECIIVFPSTSTEISKFAKQINKHVFCMTRDYLNKAIHSLVLEKGRLSSSAICEEMKVPPVDCERSMREIVSMSITTTDNSNSNRLHIVERQNELVTDIYLNDVFQSQVIPTLERIGTICISDMSMNIFHLPIVFMVEWIENRFSFTYGRDFMSNVKLVSIDGVKKLITTEYERIKEDELRDMLVNAVEPMKLKDIIDNLDWDQGLILDRMRYLCESNQIQGALHTESASQSIGALYIPFVYEQNQKETISSSFNTDGYITFEQAKHHGVSTKRVKECILDVHDKAILFHECIVHNDVIIEPLKEVVENSIQAKSFVDLSVHLPSDLLRCTDAIRSIMNEYIMNKLNASGCLIIDENESIYFSQTMIDHIMDSIIPPLVERFGRERAKVLVDENNKITEISQTVKHSKAIVNRANKAMGRLKGRGRKNIKESEDGDDTIKPGIIPLKTVVDSIVNEYTDLVEIQNTYKNLKRDVSWWSADEPEDYDGPVFGFCRIEINKNSRIDQLCSNAVYAELEWIIASKKGSTLRDAKIEAKFEETFPHACYYLQLVTKMTILDQYLNEKQRDVLSYVILHQCACFARRITEYCLFKEDVDAEEVFSFTNHDNSYGEEYFYSQIDFTQHNSKSTFLSCTDSSGKRLDPLQALRHMLPGNIGAAIARMWVLSGGNFYDGGIKISDDNSQVVRPGDLTTFLSLCEESCLSMVSYPFKILDKKVEKKLMFSRRKVMTENLEQATEFNEIFELSVLLLLQQVYGIAVYGREIYENHDILMRLFQHKKIPSHVLSLFESVSSLLKNGDIISVEQIKLIKQCGLNKDIKTHQIPTL